MMITSKTMGELKMAIDLNDYQMNIIEYNGITYIHFDEYIKYNKDNFDDLSDAQEFFNHHIPDNKKLILILEEDYIVSKKLCYAYDEPRFLFPIFVVSVEDKNLQFDGLYPYSYNYRGMYVELKYFREIL